MGTKSASALRSSFGVAATAIAVVTLTTLSVVTTPAGAQDPATPSAGQPEVLDAPQRYLDPVFDEVTVTEGRRYATVTNVFGQVQRLAMDIYEPAGDTVTERPVMVWLHGGSFQRGTRQLMSWWTEEWARRGYVSATITYRLDEEGGEVQWGRAITNATEDARSAVRWLRRNAAEFGIDKRRISMGGISAGAVTSLHSAYAAIFVPSGAPSDGYSSRISAAVSLSGADTARVDPSEPPSIMFHGDRDSVVPYDTSLVPGQGFDAVDTCLRIRAGGAECLFYTHPAGHDLTAFEEENRDAALQFLSCRVGAVSPFPDTSGRRYEVAATWAVRSNLLTAERRFLGDRALSRGDAAAAIWSLLDRPTPEPTAPTRPGDAVTRGRWATMLWEAAGSPGGAPDAGFVDVGTGDLSAAADWATANGLMRGEGSRFSPTTAVTRGQGATGLHRLASTAAAWSSGLQTAPPSTACFRVGDPPDPS